MLDIDLSQFQCPQLFVQFKWHLLQAKKNRVSVRFYYADEQDIRDVLQYLTVHDYCYCHHRHSQPFIEVNI